MRPEFYLYPNNRHGLILDGEWQVRQDPSDIGIKGQWFIPENWAKTDSSIETHTIPSCWQTWGDIWLDYQGIVWFRKDFMWKSQIKTDVPPVAALLDCTAIDFEAQIWVNDEFIGSHEGGYSRFQLDVLPALREGKNTIIIRVWDPLDNLSIPHGKQTKAWYRQISGIWGSIFLETIYVPHYIMDIYVKPIPGLDGFNVQVTLAPSQKGETGVLHIEVWTNSPSEIKEFRVQHAAMLYELNPNVTNAPQFTQKLIIPDPQCWSLDSPYLYTIIVRLEHLDATMTDECTLEVGLRWIEKRDGWIYLNGNPIILRGSLDQAFHPLTLYNYPLVDGRPDDSIRNEIRLQKQMGLNFVRKHIKIEDPRYLYWCDHEGLLYWEEMPNFLKPSYKGMKIFVQELDTMIKRDRNHSCIVIWGIFNEEWGIFGIWFNIWNLFIRKCFQHIQDLDNTRLVVDNSGWAHGRNETHINDYHHYYIIPDSARLWTEKLYQNLSKPEKNYRNWINKKEAKKIPIMISEFGCGGLPLLESLFTKPHLQVKKGNTLIPEWCRRGPDNFIQGKVFAYEWEQRFRMLGNGILPHLFEEHRNVELADQQKEWLCNKYLIEEMRRIRSPDGRMIAGYLATETTDIEWEYNGWLDYTRQPKIFVPWLPTVNADLIIILRPDRRHCFPKEQSHWTITISNMSNLTGPVEIHYNLKRFDSSNANSNGSETIIPISLRPYVIQELTPLTIDIPSLPNESKAFEFVFSARLMHEGKVITKNCESIFVWPPIPLIPSEESPIVQELTKKILDQVAEGAKIIATCEKMGIISLPALTSRFWTYLGYIRSAFKTFFHYKYYKNLHLLLHGHPQGESWVGMFSFHFADPRILSPLSSRTSFGWELVDLYPTHKFELEGLPDDIRGNYQILTGIVQGWYNQLYPTTIRIAYGKGTLIFTTLPLCTSPNRIVANHIIQNLKKLLRED